MKTINEDLIKCWGGGFKEIHSTGGTPRPWESLVDTLREQENYLALGSALGSPR